MNQLTLSNDSISITNSNIFAESFSLTESLCSDQLVFGSCEANTISLKIRSSAPVIGQELAVKFNDLDLGYYTVIEDKPTANKVDRSIKLVDRMYKILNTDCTDWYGSLTFPMTLKAFRDAFFEYLDVTQENTTLPTDELVLGQIEGIECITGQKIITDLCMINGCFGKIGRDGIFYYVYLVRSLVPAADLYPSDDIYPGMDNPGAEYSTHKYISCTYEDYEVESITGLLLIDNQNVTTAFVGTDANVYTIQDNFLLYGKTNTECEAIANTILPIITDTTFVPVDLAAEGDLDLMPGDYISINLTNGNSINTFVMSRTISGIQSLRDQIGSSCNQYINENKNTLASAIKYLKAEQDQTVTRLNDVEADNVTIHGSLNAQSARIGSLEADHVSVQELNAATARIGSLEADHVTTQQLNAVSGRVGTLEANAITTSNLYSSIAGLSSLRVTGLEITNNRFKMTYNGNDVYVGFKSVGGETVLAIL